MKFTEFGEYFKILRIKHKEILKDASKFLNVSCSFISSVECGKKAIPEDWEEKITKHYNLNESEKKKLKVAIKKSAKVVKFKMSELSSNKKELVVQFQRSFDDLDEKTTKEILDILNRNK